MGTSSMDLGLTRGLLAPGHLDEHGDHGHDDLRFFLPGEENHGAHAEEHRGEDDERRQPGVDEGGGDPARDSPPCFPHFRTSTRAPPTSISRGEIAPRAPGSIPDRISTSSPNHLPVVTITSRAPMSPVPV